MIHTSVSIQNVIARIIRNTRIQDSSYIIDMNEWIPEAMGYMRTPMESKYAYKDIDIEFHKGKLPCGLITLCAVTHKGCRLGYNDTAPYHQPHDRNTEPGLFLSKIATQDQTIYTGAENHIWKSDIVSLEDAMCLPLSGYYNIELDYINTSVMDGCVRVHYKTLPSDEQGMPLIPDNEDYKEAIYYYVLSKMMGCGYKSQVYSEQQCIQRFEAHAVRAIGAISFPSVDVMESRLQNLTRFIAPADYWSNYFHKGSQEIIG